MSTQQMQLESTTLQGPVARARIAVLLVLLSVHPAPVLAIPQNRESLMDRLADVENGHGFLCAPADGGEDLGPRVHSLIERLKSSNGFPRDPAARIEALNRFIFGDLGVRTSQDLKDPCNLLPSHVLERKQGYCVGIAALYLVLAEHLGLPIFAVATPSHVFLRYNDGATRINIETFQRGANVPDEEYIREQKIPEASICQPDA